MIIIDTIHNSMLSALYTSLCLILPTILYIGTIILDSLYIVEATEDQRG